METAASPNAAKPKSRRRWFSFSLRTLLIGMALLAIPPSYVAHEAMIVRDRKTWQKNHPERMLFIGLEQQHVYHRGNRDQGPSLVRLWIGDQPQDSVFVWPTKFATELPEAIKLFPEANVLTE